MRPHLADRVAVVTGGARGIGLAIAQRLAAAGARVVLADLPGPDLDAAGRAHPEMLAQPCDVTDAAQVAVLVARTVAHFGALDVMVANAGIAPAVPFMDLDPAQFRQVVEVNLTGAFLCTQAAARQMLAQVAQGRAPGALLLMASVQAQSVAETQAAYAAAKGGVVQLTKAAAVALAPHGIRVNAIGPGSIATGMIEATLTPALRRAIAARTPMGRLGSPGDIADLALFLASDMAGYITGQTIYADGGRLALAFTMPEREDDP